MLKIEIAFFPIKRILFKSQYPEVHYSGLIYALFYILTKLCLYELERLPLADSQEKSTKSSL